jgi:hypothetical protein
MSTTSTRLTLAGLHTEFKSDLARVTEAVAGEIARLDARIDAAQGTAPVSATRTSAPKARRTGAHKADPTAKSAAQVADDGERWQVWLGKVTDARRPFVGALHEAGISYAAAREIWTEAVEQFRAGNRDAFGPAHVDAIRRGAAAADAAGAPRNHNGRPNVPTAKLAPKAPAVPEAAPAVTADGEIAATARLRKAIAMLKGGAAGAIVTELDGVKVRITLEA